MSPSSCEASYREPSGREPSVREASDREPSRREPPSPDPSCRPTSRGRPRGAVLRAVARLLGLTRLGRLARRRRTTSDALGRRGERLAARALRRAGLRIVARRLRTRGGEVDLVAVDGETTVLVEVKTTRAGRASDGARAPGVDPASRVDRAKRARLSGAVRALLAGDVASRPYRVDVVCVVVEGRRARVEHRVGAVRASRDG